MRSLGRILQITALIALPMAMILELGGFMGRSFGLSEMLLMLIFGISAFLLGRMIEGYSLRAN